MNGRIAAVPREQGFVLVGVVMFVLALGILSLSLFSLSSYEAGFFQRSIDDERARQRAAGGVELVKSLVAMSPDLLENAKLSEGRLSITYAKAWQMVSGVADSTGPVDESRHVFFRVKTVVNGTARMVEGEYVPTLSVNPYKRLITSNGSIFYNANGGQVATNRVGTTRLERPIWQTVTTASDTAWTSYVDWPEGRPLRTQAAPVPDVLGFLASRLSGATPQVTWVNSVAADHTIRLDGGVAGSPPRYFRSPATVSTNSLASNFDFFDDPSDETVIQVRGTCIWMIPAGIRFDSKVRIQEWDGPGSDPSDHELVIVAGPNGRLVQGGTDYRDAGIWMFNGLEIESGDDVRVWLVTDGQLRLERFDENSDDMEAVGLNVFADGLFLMGPVASLGGEMRLRYRYSGDARVDYMTGFDALPGFGGAAGLDFQLVAGSWREY